MPQVTKYEEGQPSWIELSTTDEDGALAFYGSLFGWQDEAVPMGNDMFYHMPKLNGLTVAGLAEQMEDERSQGIPPHWRVYFTVSNADQAAERVKQAGGNVIFGPMDVFEAGRMAMAFDPQGAMFAIWEPKAHIGSNVKDEPGAFTWAELLTRDSKQAAAFYEKVLGHEVVSVPGQPQTTLLKVGGHDVATAMDIRPEMGPLPPHWAVYFGADDVDATAEKAKSLGATVMAAQDIPGIGRFAVVRDPQGAVFNVFKGV
jgi:predicted enzyme related to lactoylglutathione lyase